MVKKSLFLVTVLVVVGLVAGCAAAIKTLKTNITDPFRDIERIKPSYSRHRIVVAHPEDERPRDRLQRAQREPDGFRGIKFGTDISALEDMVFVRKRIVEGGYAWTGKHRDLLGMAEEYPDWETKVYVRKNEIMQIGNVPLDKIEYFFWEGKFCYVELICNDPYNDVRLTRICSEQFGPRSAGLSTNAELCRVWGSTWVGEKTIVDLDIGGVQVGRTTVEAAEEEMTWDEAKEMYKIEAELGAEHVALPSTRVGPLRLRIMTKEAAEQLHYRVEIKEKKEKGEF